MLQGPGPLGYYYKVLTRRIVEREFKACWPSLLGVLFLNILLLDPCSWILVPHVVFSFLAFRSWALLLVVLEVLG
jgi:hypothetical protein